ncbi:hypothetical protein QTH97_28045 [Variovorax sp. J22R24]|uniref:hypothetical protein n=1 Tax=Variovorax gracilis TaxID=3053502 RepID=UPI002576D4FD|nr:hypothetical protein [Variovorax sp. J22R24]MDM0108824.1 hypothetical protein [Variovorax sp. J22R24]
MTRRDELVHTIQTLSRDEALRQPSAAEWLRQQDAQASASRATGERPRPPACAQAHKVEKPHPER